MRKHAHLPAMVGLMSNHVAQHLHANGPVPAPSIPAKRPDPAPTTESLRNHLGTPTGALRQRRPRLLRSAPRAIELRWSLKMRSRQPDPLASHVMHMGKDRRNGPHIARRLGL